MRIKTIGTILKITVNARSMTQLKIAKNTLDIIIKNWATDEKKRMDKETTNAIKGLFK